MMPNTDHKINLLQQTKKIVVDPPPQITGKEYTGATVHYFTQADVHASVDVQQKNGSPS